MEFSTPISRTSPFPVLGVLGGIFHFYAASDLALYCLPMSLKKDARLISVNIFNTM